jgi:integrase/recombinase XerD
MEDFKQQMTRAFDLRGLQRSTRRSYTYCVAQFSRFHGDRHPQDLGTEEVRAYFEHLAGAVLTASTVGVSYAALSYYYRHVVQRPEVMLPIPRRKRHRKVPEILSVAEVGRLFAAMPSLRARTIAMLMYGSGLRVSEACALRIEDIDSARNVLRVREGKGGHDRYTLLGAPLLAALRTYWKERRPRGPLLFPGLDPSRPITRDVVQRAVKAAAKSAGLRKRVTPHTLRHCFATHMIESGAELRTVQVLLGHASVNSTTIYVRVGIERLSTTSGPLDMLASLPR